MEVVPNEELAVNIQNMIGTWELVHSSSIRYENGIQTEQWDEDVPAGNVRFIIAPQWRLDVNGVFQ